MSGQFRLLAVFLSWAWWIYIFHISKCVKCNQINAYKFSKDVFQNIWLSSSIFWFWESPLLLFWAEKLICWLQFCCCCKKLCEQKFPWEHGRCCWLKPDCCCCCMKMFCFATSCCCCWESDGKSWKGRLIGWSHSLGPARKFLNIWQFWVWVPEAQPWTVKNLWQFGAISERSINIQQSICLTDFY